MFYLVNAKMFVEKRLKEDESLLDAAFNANQSYIYAIDDSFKILRQNEFAKKLFSAKEGERCFSVFNKRSSPCVGCPVLTIKGEKMSKGLVYCSILKRHVVVSVAASKRIGQSRTIIVTGVEASNEDLKYFAKENENNQND
jgi:hypothetical protein